MQTITSREYKIMLRAAKFKGDEPALTGATSALWRDLAGIALPHVVSLSGGLDTVGKGRRIRFFDTAGNWLRASDYIVRERVDLEKGTRELTLKFRHPDRYITQDRKMAPAEGYPGEIKLEEDIKPEFLKLYSFSSTVTVPEEGPLATLADVGRIFPGLPDAVDAFPGAEALQLVGNFTAFERVVSGARFQIRREPEVLAECVLVVWYAGDAADTKPALAEFSFKYKDEAEAFTGKMARRAYRVFMDIQSQLGDWIDAKSLTKTAYVYGLRK